MNKFKYHSLKVLAFCQKISIFLKNTVSNHTHKKDVEKVSEGREWQDLNQSTIAISLNSSMLM